VKQHLLATNNWTPVALDYNVCFNSGTTQWNWEGNNWLLSNGTLDRDLISPRSGLVRVTLAVYANNQFCIAQWFGWTLGASG